MYKEQGGELCTGERREERRQVAEESFVLEGGSSVLGCCNLAYEICTSELCPLCVVHSSTLHSIHSALLNPTFCT